MLLHHIRLSTLPRRCSPLLLFLHRQRDIREVQKIHHPRLLHYPLLRLPVNSKINRKVIAIGKNKFVLFDRPLWARSEDTINHLYQNWIVSKISRCKEYEYPKNRSRGPYVRGSIGLNSHQLMPIAVKWCKAGVCNVRPQRKFVRPTKLCQFWIVYETFLWFGLIWFAWTIYSGVDYCIYIYISHLLQEDKPLIMP